MAVNSFRSKCSLTGLKIKGDYGKTFNEAMLVQQRQAAREWLRTILDGVPQWSGQLIGSIIAAEGNNGEGEICEYLHVSPDIHPLFPKANKNLMTANDTAHFSFTSGQNKYAFSFWSDLNYFEENDLLPRNIANERQQRIAPWRLMEEAAGAYQAYFAEFGFKRLPKILEGFAKVQITSFLIGMNSQSSVRKI